MQSRKGIISSVACAPHFSTMKYLPKSKAHVVNTFEVHEALDGVSPRSSYKSAILNILDDPSKNYTSKYIEIRALVRQQLNQI